MQDSREQQGLFARIPSGLTVKSCPLSVGDYSIDGFEKNGIVVERKGVSDLMSYIGKEREKTIIKLQRLQSYEWAGLVIEVPESQILSPQLYSKITPEQVRGFLVSVEIRYGIHIYYAKYKSDVARWVLDRLIKFYNIHRELPRGGKKS